MWGELKVGNSLVWAAFSILEKYPREYNFGPNKGLILPPELCRSWPLYKVPIQEVRMEWVNKQKLSLRDVMEPEPSQDTNSEQENTTTYVSQSLKEIYNLAPN